MQRQAARTRLLRSLVCSWACIAISTSAHAYLPLPWDAPLGDDVEPDGVYQPYRRARTPGRASGRRELFGTAAVFFDASVVLDGHVPGVSEGRGYTLDIPATFPAWLLYSIFVNPLAVFSTLTEEAWTSGFRGPGLRTSPVFNEIDFELLYSLSSHDDELHGGGVDYTRLGLGARLSGPAPSERRVRASLALGWTWHVLDFDRRRNLAASGPYLGFGVETRFTGDSRRSRSDSMLGVRLNARWDFVRGADGTGGDFDAAVFTGGAGVAFYW